MARPKITVEAWERWFTTKRVFDRALKALGPNECWAAVVDRIRGGHINAAARSTSSSKGHAETTVNPDPFLIPLGFWLDWVEDTSRLKAGDARFHIPPHRYGGNFRTDPALEVLCFGIRLDPEHVELHIPRDDDISPGDLPVYGVGEKGPVVSDDHLREWARLFRAAYPTGSEALAAKSAGGMFPGKSVPRVKLRAALETVGKLPRGRRRDS